MLRLLSFVIFGSFLLCCLGCGGGGGTEDISKKINTAPRPVDQTPKPKPEPTPEQKWLMEKCGQCHDKPTLGTLAEKVGSMTKEDLESALRTKCLAALATHEGAAFTEEDVAEALRLHQMMLDQKAKTAAPTGEAPAEAPK